MAVVEILGDRMHRVFKEHDIEYKKTYNKKCNPKKKYDPHYEVYEISQNDMKRLDGIFELPDGSWWRWCKGSNMGTPYECFQVNGRELIAWGGARRESLILDWSAEPADEKASYNYSFKEYEKTICPYEYENLTSYMCDELGASTEKNVCALAVDLARANGMTMAQLFKAYEG